MEGREKKSLADAGIVPGAATMSPAVCTQEPALSAANGTVSLNACGIASTSNGCGVAGQRLAASLHDRSVSMNQKARAQDPGLLLVRWVPESDGADREAPPAIARIGRRNMHR
jgi:hypothetical protein